MKSILIKDQTIGSKSTYEIEIEVSKKEISLKELIEMRVIKEVDRYNSNNEKPYLGLVIPTEQEAILNTNKEKKERKIDMEKQIYVALDGFQKNRFFVLIDDRQLEDLEERIKIGVINEIHFIKLTPLVGG